MVFKEKLLLGLCASVMPLSILNDYLGAKTDLYQGKVREILASGYTNEIALPFGVYFGLKLINGDSFVPKLHVPIVLGLSFLAEIAQKQLQIGTYDEQDFLAYAVGMATAVIADKLIFKKPRPSLEGIIAPDDDE